MLKMLSLKNYPILNGQKERNLKQKGYYEKYRRILNRLEQENLFLKDEINRKNKVINILLKNLPNHVPEHSNYMKSKNTEVSCQTHHEAKNNIQAFTAGNKHCTKIARGKENDKNQKKLNINQLNSKICDKTCVNVNSDTEEREPICISLRGNIALRGNSVCILYVSSEWIGVC